MNMKGIVRRRSRREHSLSMSLFDQGDTQPSTRAAIPEVPIPESEGTTQAVVTSRADDGDRFSDARLAELGIPVRHPASAVSPALHDAGQVLPRSGTDKTTDTSSRLLEKPAMTSSPQGGVHSAKDPVVL